MPFNTFGGNATSVSNKSYIALDITNNSITLVWPDAYVDVPYTDPNTGISYNSVSFNINVTTALGNTHTITLPDATLTSVGQNFVINNIGLGSFDLLKSDGSPLITIFPSGVPNQVNSYYVILTSNTTGMPPNVMPDPVGTWYTVAFGAGSSSLNPFDLAGLGLIAQVPTATKISTNIPVQSFNALPVTIDAGSRASLIVWTGGNVTLDLPTLASLAPNADGYYVSFSNQGLGQLTISSVDTARIDGTGSITVFAQQSLTLICDGTNWFSLGFGQNQSSETTLNSITLTTSPRILTPSESSSLLQKFNSVGDLTNDVTVYFPAQVDNWIISNNTTGPYKVRVQLTTIGPPPVPTGNIFIIPQGTTQAFGSDGVTLYPIPTSFQLINGGDSLSPGIPLTDGTDDGGIYYSEGIAFGGIFGFVTKSIQLARLYASDDQNTGIFELSSATELTKLEIDVNDVQAQIFYNGNAIFNIDTTGIFSLINPLQVTSGGTDANTQAQAAINVLPPAVAGNMLFFDGTNWVVVPPGATSGTKLTWTSATTVPTWM